MPVNDTNFCIRKDNSSKEYRIAQRLENYRYQQKCILRAKLRYSMEKIFFVAKYFIKEDNRIEFFFIRSK